MRQARHVNRSFRHLLAIALAGFSMAGSLPAMATALPTAAPSSSAEPAPPVPVPPPPPAPPAHPGNTAAMQLLNAAVGTRLSLRMQDPVQHKDLGDLGMDGQVQVLLTGQFNRIVRWQADFVGSLGPANQTDSAADPTGPPRVRGNAAVLDLIARFDFHDVFNLWLGRMLVPADRSGLSTEWLMAAWLFPGQFDSKAAPVGTRQGPYGRSDGATLWGHLSEGRFKYYLGAYDLGEPTRSPLYSGRISLAIFQPETGYRHASSYYGSKDVLTLGLGFQHQTDGSINPEPKANEPNPKADFNEFNLDLLFEKNLGVGGVIDLEGALYNIWGKYEPVTAAYFVLASYLLPIEVGLGRFQPLFRLQQAYKRGSESVDTIADAQLGYVVDGHTARLSLGYQYKKFSGQAANAVLVGLQLQTR